jgi:hypothetical protein
LATVFILQIRDFINAIVHFLSFFRGRHYWIEALVFWWINFFSDTVKVGYLGQFLILNSNTTKWKENSWKDKLNKNDRTMNYFPALHRSKLPKKLSKKHPNPRTFPIFLRQTIKWKREDKRAVSSNNLVFFFIWLSKQFVINLLVILL